MKLRILSDLHVEFEDFEPPPVDADVVVLAGDIHVRHHGVDWARERFPGVPVLYVLGNHEYYGHRDKPLPCMPFGRIGIISRFVFPGWKGIGWSCQANA